MAQPRYLLHLDAPGIIQFITFRLADSMPGQAIAQWKSELTISRHDASSIARSAKLRTRIGRYLDQGHGSCQLSDERIAKVVEDALLHFDGARYHLLAWAIMPNHVHALIKVFDGFPLDGVIYTWKSFTAKQANRLLGRSGRFWAPDYYDRQVRDDEHLAAVMNYIDQNPVDAGLVRSAEDWQWGSASKRRARRPRSQGEVYGKIGDAGSC